MSGRDGSGNAGSPAGGPPRDRRGVGDRWLAGERIPGVEFARSDPVEIVQGTRTGSSGVIALLVALEPEPAYLVELATGAGDVRVRQSALRRRG